MNQDRLVARVVELARAHGYTGNRLAMLPPSPEILQTQAPAETSLSAERLHSQFLVPMRESVRCGRLMAELEFPDYILSRETIRQKVKELMGAGKEEEARQYLAQIRDKIAPLLEKISRDLGALPQAQRYVAEWQRLLELNHGKR